MVKYRLLLTLAVLMMSAACGDASRTENVAQDDGTEGDEIPAVPLGELEESSVPQSLDGLVAEAHAVVRGRFLPGPTEAGSQVERTAGIDEVVSIWDFRVEEILRNTYRSDFALSGSETIHVASLGGGSATCAVASHSRHTLQLIPPRSTSTPTPLIVQSSSSYDLAC